jgi:hypothetical protein
MSGSSFVQKILLEGADVVNKQLKDLGEIGQQAMQKVQTSANQAVSGLTQFQSAISGLFSGVKEMAQGFDSSFGEVVSDIGDATIAAAKFGAGFGGIVASAAAVSAAVGHMGQSAADSISKVNDLAEKAGLTLEKYQQFKAAGEGIGLGATDFAKAAEAAKDAVEKLQGALGKGIRIDVSAEEQKTQPLSDIEKKYDAMRKLGVALKDEEGELRGAGEIVQDFIASLAKIENASQKSALATQFFGKALGEAMISASGSLEKVNQNMDAVSQSGIKFSDGQKETIDAARRSGVALGAVIGQWKDYALALASSVSVDQNNSMLKFFADNREAIKSFLDDYVGPAIRWLGELKNTLGAASIAAAVLGLSFGAIGPVTAAALAIAGGAFIFFWDDVKKYATSGMATIKGIIAGNNLTSWDGWKAAAATAWSNIVQYVAQAYQRIKSYTLEAFPSLTGIWNAVENAFSSAWTYIVSQSKAGFPDLVAWWEKLKGAASFAWDVIKTGADLAWSAIQKIMDIANQAAGVINGMFGTNFTGATLLATIIFGYLAAKLIEVPGYIKAITLVMSPFATAFAILSGAVKIAAAAIDFILGKIQQLTDWLSDKLIDGLHMLAGDELWTSMKNAAAGTLNFIQSALEAIQTAAKAAWNALKGGGDSPSAPPIKKDEAPGASDPARSGIVRSWAPGKSTQGSSGEYAPPASTGSGTAGGIGDMFANVGHSLSLAFDDAVGDIKRFGASLSEAASSAAHAVTGGFAAQPSSMVPAFAGGAGAGARPHAGEVAFTLNMDGNRAELSGLENDVDKLKRFAADVQASGTLKNKPSWDK